MSFLIFNKKSRLLLKNINILLVAILVLSTIPGFCKTKLESLMDEQKNLEQRYFQTLTENGPGHTFTQQLFEKLSSVNSEIKTLKNSSYSYDLQQESVVMEEINPATPSYTVDANAMKNLAGTWQADLALANLFTMQGNLDAADELFQSAFGKASNEGYTYELFRQTGFAIMDKLVVPIDIPDPVVTTQSYNNNGDWAQNFDKTMIVPDNVLIDSNSMTKTEVKNFLASKSSVLSKPYRGQDPADMIMAAANKYGISPMIIIATLQKEQGLVSKTDASEHTLDWALGVGCYDSGNWNEKFKGLDKQIEYCANTYKRHYDDAQEKIQNNETLTMEIDGKNITIDNAATWAFYKYTPHFAGNELFVKVYKGYFVN